MKKFVRFLLFLALLGLILPISKAEATGAPFEIPVLVLKYFPLGEDGRLDPEVTGMNGELSAVRAKINQVTNEAVLALGRGSTYHGYKDPSAASSLGYFVIEEIEYLSAMPVSQNQVPWNRGWYRPDYQQILNEINICDWVDSRGIKEVWVWGYHYGGLEPNESNMAMGRVSQTWWNHDSWGDVSNGEQINDMPVCQKTYTLYNYNYGQGGLGNVLEDHTHQLEAIFKFINWDLFWKKFVGMWASGDFYRCGWTHNPPNTIAYYPQRQYDWSSEEEVLSDCEDWRADGSGEKKPVNCHTWAGEDCDKDTEGKPNALGSAFKIWWMQNLPGEDNNVWWEGKKMINWWEYIGDFDNALSKTNKSFFPIPRPTPTPIPIISFKGYDLQITSVNVCHLRAAVKTVGDRHTLQGTFQIRFWVRNNGTVYSLPTNVAFDLGEYLGNFGYPTIVTCPVPKINGGYSTYSLCQRDLVYGGGTTAWLDLDDDDNSNNEYSRIYWGSPCY